MIHPTAIIDPAASLADDVSVGPFTIIGPDVEIASGTTIGPHVTLRGPTRIGRQNRIFQYASIGDEPQDKKFKGEKTGLEIGDRNTIREFVTINRGTVQDRGLTSIGNDNWIMAYVHVAHDCVIGDRTVFANGSSLAGHVLVGDDAILGGFSLVHQFCNIGAHAFTAMGSTIKQDVPPFITVSGNPAVPHGVNAEGLRRRGFEPPDIQILRRAYRTLYKSGLRLEQAIDEIQPLARDCAAVGELLEFIASAKRGLVR
ncbi:acyl-ACP--UDP-N-acetylglucosamine O-acyltransferase [Methylonatrum kenyense]|uniref:acyl-ACP--UDP-N-acetylglucosamine O-acyltransferase n=1 Tax=Methylonatrum kenyense TaxID=455253 RepID=UPI0020C0BFE7|nr:acyl-ACP--UDP-N-acetylglucosamine O-acyltransferase [Methylonatrum kenyense]MCK8516384.1 acyl-ACP--UDP-N-acetylglucosamine O-acyltransferase [Methylonatrum kenyense]